MELHQLVGPLLTWVRAVEPGQALASLAMVEGGVLIRFALRAARSNPIRRALELPATTKHDEVVLAR